MYFYRTIILKGLKCVKNMYQTGTILLQNTLIHVYMIQLSRLLHSFFSVFFSLPTSNTSICNINISSIKLFIFEENENEKCRQFNNFMIVCRRNVWSRVDSILHVVGHSGGPGVVANVDNR